MMESHEERVNSSVQRSDKKVESGFGLEDIAGYVFHRIVRKVTTAIRHSVRLSAYADFCLRRTFLILNSAIFRVG